MDTSWTSRCCKIVSLAEEQRFYAFATFADDQSAQALIQANVKFKGRALNISRAKEPKIKTGNNDYVEGATKLFVGAIPSNVTLDELRLHFARYGAIKEATLPLKNAFKGINKGHGFVTYHHAHAAQLAVESFSQNVMRAKYVS